MNIVNTIISSQFAGIKSTELLLGESFMGVWTVGVSYLKGQVVSANGNLYVCLIDHEESHQPPDLVFWDDITMRGPVGPAGPPGSPGGTGSQPPMEIYRPSGAVLGAHRAVILNSLGSAIYADSSDSSHVGRVIGMTMEAVTVIGENIRICQLGEVVEPTWYWDIAKSVFFGTNGQLTQVPPSIGFMQVIGQPITAQSMFLNPQPSITLA